MNPNDLTEGSVVVIAAFDDVLEHQFEVQDICHSLSEYAVIFSCELGAFDT